RSRFSEMHWQSTPTARHHHYSRAPETGPRVSAVIDTQPTMRTGPTPQHPIQPVLSHRQMAKKSLPSLVQQYPILSSTCHVCSSCSDNPAMPAVRVGWPLTDPFLVVSLNVPAG